MIRLEKWVEKQQRKKKGFFINILFVASKCYEGVVYLRHLLMDVKLLTSHKSAIPVISIGNIVSGGCGKTELVSKILTDLQKDDIAIVTRGYRKERKCENSRLVKDNKDGDEPFMLLSRHPNTNVIVGRKREESCSFAKKLGAKAVLLDDGMQYIKLEKDIQITCVRAKNFDGGGFLPYGMRRELLSKLSVSDYVMIHGAIDKQNYELVKRSVLCYCSANCFATRYHLCLSKELTNNKVGVFCGIGNPQPFMDGIEDQGIDIVHTKVLADHEKMSSIKEFAEVAFSKGAREILCTEKDYIKLKAEEKKLVTPISLTMQVVFEHNNYEKMIDNIDKLIETTQGESG